MKLARRIILACGILIWTGIGNAQNRDLTDPVDERLKAAYLRIRFSQQYPEDAVRFIQTQLVDAQKPLAKFAALAKDPRKEVRTLVALLLGEYGDADGARLLWDLTRDELEQVRLTAGGSIVRLAEAVPVVADTSGLKDQEPSIRRLTANVLHALTDKKAEDALIDTLTDTNELVRADVVKALNKSACGTDKALPALLKTLRDPSVTVRDRSARVLQGFNDPSVVEPLMEALKDPDWHVRAAAADSLGAWVTRTPVVIDPLIQRLEQDDFALVRDRAADALAGLINDERVIPPLVKALAAEHRDVRFHAAQAIMRSKSTIALPLLAEEWRRTTPAAGERDAFPELRVKIMEIFGAIGGSDQLPMVIEGTSDTEPQVQLAAVNALRRLKERGGAKQLHSCLTSKNPHIRAAAVRAMGELGDKDATTKILPLLHDDNGFVRSAAAEALGKLGDRTAIIPLIQLLTDENLADDPVARGLVLGTKEAFMANLEVTAAQAKIRLVDALGVLRAPEAVEPIIKHGLSSKDIGLRASSAYALGRIGDRRAVEPLVNVVRAYYDAAPTTHDLENVISPGAAKVPDESRRLKEKESRVRASVAWALGQIGDPSSKEILLKAMNDQNSLVRDSAFEALAKITESEELRQGHIFDAEQKQKAAPPPQPK